MKMTDELIAAALSSTQTEFESVLCPPDNSEWITFMTNVEDAPVQVVGYLGSDGTWYVYGPMFPPPDHDGSSPPPEVDEHTLILRAEPVAEAMVRDQIRRLLTSDYDVLEGSLAEARRAFMRRLQASRFAPNPN